MKKHLSMLSLLAVLSVLYACQNKDAFSIKGTVANAGSVKKIYLLEADTTTLNVVDSAEIGQDGAFKFARKSPAFNLYKLRVGSAIFDLITKNGEEVKFETDLNSKDHDYTVSGSEESSKIKEFNQLTNTLMEKNNAVYAKYEAEMEATHKEDSLNNIYRPIFMKNTDEFSEKVLKFAGENKKSMAAFYAILKLEPYKYEAQMIAFADNISDDMKQNMAVQRFVKQMEFAKPISVGQKAPDFTLNSMDGKPVRLSDYKGRYVMLDFWASWCPPCRQENPNVVKLYNLYKGKGLNILGISLDTKKANWQQAIEEDKLNWQHASDLQEFDGPTEKLYHITGIPSNFIIDPQGKIIAKNITGNDLAVLLSKTFGNL